MRPLEKDIQAAIEDALRLCGYDVLHTNTHGVRRATGASKGVPDLLVSRSGWWPSTWIGLEVKRPGGKWSSPEQQDLNERGRTVRVESVLDALKAMNRAEIEQRGNGYDAIRGRLYQLIDQLEGKR